MSSKRQTTVAKMTRENTIKERRARKQEKKQAARDAKAAAKNPGAPTIESESP